MLSLALGCIHAGTASLHCPRQAPLAELCLALISSVSCSTVLPNNDQLPDSGKRICMQRFLQFRLGCQGLPTAAGCCACCEDWQTVHML